VVPAPTLLPPQKLQSEQKAVQSAIASAQREAGGDQVQLSVRSLPHALILGVMKGMEVGQRSGVCPTPGASR
jgi:hypothetical protein